MLSDLMAGMKIAAQGMHVQGIRIRTLTENVANSDTAGAAPGADPYARQTITFKNVMDKEIGAFVPTVAAIEKDTDTPFPLEYMPDHPAADAKGFVKMPNVNTLIEMGDIREAQRTYDANLGMIEQGRSLLLKTIDLLR